MWLRTAACLSCSSPPLNCSYEGSAAMHWSGLQCLTVLTAHIVMLRLTTHPFQHTVCPRHADTRFPLLGALGAQGVLASRAPPPYSAVVGRPRAVHAFMPPAAHGRWRWAVSRGHCPLIAIQVSLCPISSQTATAGAAATQRIHAAGSTRSATRCAGHGAPLHLACTSRCCSLLRRWHWRRMAPVCRHRR